MNKKSRECEIIDFYPNNNVPVNTTFFYKFLRSLKHFITYPVYIKHKKREKLFNLYRNKYYKVSQLSYFGDSDIKKKKLNYDVLISGSDQIFNMTLTGNSTAYYLDFENGVKKISYASSFGRETISQEEIKTVKSELPKFHKISVRERSASDIIKKITGLESTMVVDPVFLLSTDEWKKRCDINKKLPPKYIFVYSMETSKNLELVVNKIKQSYGVPIIIVRGGGKVEGIKGKEDLECGPEDFLKYISDAELIITNSFHGSAMSIIFKKKFICVAHSKRNVRLYNLISLIESGDKIINNQTNTDKVEDFIIDGAVGFTKMDKIINSSKEYLIDVLNN